MEKIEGTLKFPEKPKHPLKVLYILPDYPQLSQTYQHEEIVSLADAYSIEILSLFKPNLSRKKFYSHYQECSHEDVFAFIEKYSPDILHSHYFRSIGLLAKCAKEYSVPFTIRTHSFDILKPETAMLKQMCQLANSKLCRGILAFPDFKQRLLECGLEEEKLVSCWPVVNYDKFYNPEKPAFKGKIMNVGAAIGKKNYKSFIDLANNMRNTGFTFNLFAIGYKKSDLLIYNETQGKPVNTIDHIEPEEMPEAYRNHDWLVYTADQAINTVGLPLAIAEAQASGIGVCMQELPGRKKGLLEYLGGGGYLFNDISELPEILNKPYPEEMRLKGLENAKKCDVFKHNALLKERWTNPNYT